MWRWTKRISITLVVLFAIGLAILFWAHRQTKHVPDFYTEAIEQKPERAIEASQELAKDVQRLQAEAGKRGAWQATFSDAEINAWLMEELPKKFPKMLARGVSDPRIAIRDGRMLVAAKYKDKRFDTVVSCEVTVKLTEQANMLAIQISELRAGALPLPMQRFLKKISSEAAKGDIDVQWDITDQGPIALVSVPSEHPKYVVNPVIVESLRLDDGQLMVDGHSGDDADASYQPRSNVHRFVSYSPKESLDELDPVESHRKDQGRSTVASSIGSASKFSPRRR